MTVEASKDRRGARRVYLGSGRRLEWRKCGSTAPRRKGWLKDTSLSGVSFLVEANRLPRVGDKLEMGPRHGSRPALLYRVVRIARLEGQIAMIGCRCEAPAAVASLAA